MGDDGQGNRADRSDCAALSFTASDLSIVIETGIDIAAFNNHGSSLTSVSSAIINGAATRDGSH